MHEGNPRSDHLLRLVVLRLCVFCNRMSSCSLHARTESTHTRSLHVNGEVGPRDGIVWTAATSAACSFAVCSSLPALRILFLKAVGERGKERRPPLLDLELRTVETARWTTHAGAGRRLWQSGSTFKNECIAHGAPFVVPSTRDTVYEHARFDALGDGSARQVQAVCTRLAFTVSSHTAHLPPPAVPRKSSCSVARLLLAEQAHAGKPSPLDRAVIPKANAR